MTTLKYVTLIYDWAYKVHGKHVKRNYEYPVEIKGRSRQTFGYDPSKTTEEQDKEIKEKMKEDLILYYRQKAIDEFERPEDEEVDYEEFKFYNIREATRWSDLEDFSYSR